MWLQLILLNKKFIPQVLLLENKKSNVIYCGVYAKAWCLQLICPSFMFLLHLQTFLINLESSQKFLSPIYDSPLFLYIYCSRKLCTAIFVLHNIKVLISADDEMITNIKHRPNSYNFLVLVIEMISSTMNFRA